MFFMIVIWILILNSVDRIIYPFFEKKLNIGFPLLQRIGTGFAFASGSMFMASFIEIARKNSGIIENRFSTCDESINLHKISIFWQFPQYVLVGTSEVMAAIAGLEFFYDQAPTSMKTIIYSLNLVTNGFGSLMSTILILIVNSDNNNKWITSDLDKGYLEYYFGLLGCLMAFSLIIFIYFAQKYTYKLDDTMPGMNDVRKFSQSDRGRPRTCCKLLKCW